MATAKKPAPKPSLFGKGYKPTPDEKKYLPLVVARAKPMAAEVGRPIDWTSFEMDLVAANRDCGIDWEKLLKADDATFGHDVWGIRRFIDRDTEKLGGNFLPRCHA